MNFREFLLNEDRHYYAYKLPSGQYQVSSQFFINPKERDREAKSVDMQLHPARMWKFSVKPGDHQFVIPGANPQERDEIGLAYYHRMFGQTLPHFPDFGSDEGDIIEPKDFDPNYGKRAAKVLFPPSQDKTISYPR